MSPVSRVRRPKQRRTRGAQLRVVDPGACDCPDCREPALDLQALLDGLLALGADLVDGDDALDAELIGASLASMRGEAGERFHDALVENCFPAWEAKATPNALALLLAIGSVAPGRLGKAATAAADHLVAVGVPPPSWAAQLDEPVSVADTTRIADVGGTGSVLACSFQRAGHSHAVLISVDQVDCGAASGIALLGSADQLPEALEVIRESSDERRYLVTTETPQPDEFRWLVQAALDARAVHDSARADDGEDEDVEDKGPGYHTMALLLRRRMADLPAPTKAPRPHPAETRYPIPRELLNVIAKLGRGEVPAPPAGVRGGSAGLPPKRAKSAGPAPIYRIKVGLAGARPPIWRRLELPADVSLARLHSIIQTTFGWDDSHLHVFETPYGQFGMADRDLGHRPEAPVTLEQVAPGVSSKLRYVYDFGDDWRHDIVVEQVLDRDPRASYPRCTGGRQAAPPEDCGGVWGYARLLKTLGDPAHPEHEETLQWLGLHQADDFAPERFNPGEVTRALARQR